MPENRVLKFNEANVQRQKEVGVIAFNYPCKSIYFNTRQVSKQHANLAAKNKKAASKSKAKTEPSALGSSSKDSSKDSDSRATTPSKELSKDQQLTTGTTGTAATDKSSTNSSIHNNSSNVGGGSKETGTIKEGKVENENKETRSSSAASVTGNSQTSTTTSTTTTTTTTSISTSSSRRSINKSGENVSNEAPKKKRSRLEMSIENEEQFVSRVEVKIKIPDELKPCLVDDWDAITRQHKLVDLPAAMSVEEIIDNYVQYKKATKTITPHKETAILEVANGLVEYFNVTLGSQLLYKFERPQYAELLEKHPNQAMSKIYGSVHLLRLFIKLGSMLAFTALDEKTLQLLLVHIHDFLKYLVKNASTFFSIQQFVNCPADYHRKAQ